MQGAVVSGIQNQEEIDFIVGSWISMYGSTGSMWVGAQRTAACWTLQGQTAACSKTTSFEWTDNSATGTDGYVWNSAVEPNNVGGMEQCLVLTWTGLMSDQTCARTDYVGYVCGKAPM